VAELRFSYGVMSAGKSTLALQVEHTWTEAGRAGVLLTSHDRGGSGRVTSRLGLARDAVEVSPDTDVYALLAVSPSTTVCPSRTTTPSTRRALSRAARPHQHSTGSGSGTRTSASSTRRRLPGNSRVRKSDSSPKQATSTSRSSTQRASASTCSGV